MTAARTITAEARTVTLDRPGQAVTFTFPDPQDQARRSRISIPPGSRWSPSPHWHERYDEYFKVVRGKVILEVDGIRTTIGPDDGVMVIQKYQVHEFWRADVQDAAMSIKGPVEVEEWTDPCDGLKEVFFRNLSSVLLAAPQPFSWRTIVQISVIGAWCDDWPVMVEGRFRWLATHVVYRAERCIGTVLGLKAWYPEYTPARLRDVASQGGA